MSLDGGLLDNVVRFAPDVPKRLHFTEGGVHDVSLVDPTTKVAKMVSALQLVVDQEDGAAVAKTLSITASGFADQLSPYLAAGAIAGFDFIVTARGSGFSRRYAVEALPRR